MLKIQNICAGYKARNITKLVLKDFSLTIGEGEAAALLGPSGCGKSTLLHVLCGDLPKESGKALLVREKEGREESAELNPAFHKIGLIPQNGGLLPWKTIEANCFLPKKARKEPVTQRVREDFAYLSGELGIRDILDRYPYQLSGGQRQRAAVLRAFLFQPDLLLMDEPFSALDAIKRQEAQELFLHVWKRRRSMALFVTHSMEEALFIGQRILVMDTDGKIIYERKNPYFGSLFPRETGYLSERETLRRMLTAGEHFPQTGGSDA